MTWTGNISFFGTDDLIKTDKFYREIFGLEIYKDQGKCKIYKVPGGGMIAFCEHMEVLATDKSPIITFLTEDVEGVYSKFENIEEIELESEPIKNDEFKIYQFFAKDPNGYTIEIQKFLNWGWLPC